MEITSLATTVVIIMEYGCLILGIFHVVIRIIRTTNTHFEKPGLIRINCDVAIFNLR